MSDVPNNDEQLDGNGRSMERAFPKVTDTQIEELDDLAELEHYADGTYLFRAGEQDISLFVVRSGRVDVIDESGDDEERLVQMRERDLIGDLSTLEGRPAQVSARAAGDCTVYRISPENLQRIVSQKSELSDLILGAFISRHDLLEAAGYTGLRVIGSRYSSDTLRIREFLDRNHVLHSWIDVEQNPDVHTLLERLHVHVSDTPVVGSGTEWVLRNPSNTELANRLGIKKPVGNDLYDLAIVGAGPAGLAAAVYGASEGLRTVVLERTAPGGQAGASSKIENYLGFPTGLSGQELADRAKLQAQKFGAQLTTPAEATALHVKGYFPALELDDGQRLIARCVLIATGAEYRALPVQGYERFNGAGIYYAATVTEAMMCENEQLAVVGAGNSAGQAAVFLSEHARSVLLLVRGEDLKAGMSSYLAERIRQTDNIDVRFHTEIREVIGEDHLVAIDLEDNQTGTTERIDTPAVFCFVGSTPRTGWLPEAVLRDSQGFVETGSSVENRGVWSARRSPFFLETSVPGVFAAGDVRSGSVKRVATAVGEGAMVVQFVHEHLAQGAW